MKIPSSISSSGQVFWVLQQGGFRPQCIYDIGASTGCWSASMVSIFPGSTFHLFEPLADFHPPYREALDRALTAHANFHLHPMALGETLDMVSMAVSVQPEGSTVLNIPVSEHFPRQVRVPRQTIDELVEQQILAAPDVLKVDVQGSEDQVLRGAVRTLDRVQVLQVECWLSRGYGPGTALLQDIVGFLEDSGFYPVEFSDPYYNEAHRLYTLDLYFLNQDLGKKLAGRIPQGPWCSPR